jgi:hypothetical protein
MVGCQWLVTSRRDGLLSDRGASQLLSNATLLMRGLLDLEIARIARLGTIGCLSWPIFSLDWDKASGFSAVATVDALSSVRNGCLLVSRATAQPAGRSCLSISVWRQNGCQKEHF